MAKVNYIDDLSGIDMSRDVEDRLRVFTRWTDGDTLEVGVETKTRSKAVQPAERGDGARAENFNAGGRVIQMNFRSYQTPAIDFLCVRRRGAVKSPAGSGKTLIAAGAVHKVIGMRVRSRAVKVGWLANTLEQKQQAFMAMVEVFHGVRVEPVEAEQYWLGKEQIAASIYFVDLRVECAAANIDWSDRDLLIVDECHHIVAPQWRGQVDTCTGALWGFTATPPEDEFGRASFIELFQHVHEVPRSAVAGNLAAARVVWVDKTDQGIRPHMDALINMEVERRKRFSSMDGGQIWAQVAWGICVEHGIVHNKLRNDAIVALARRHARNHVLILVNQIEHGQSLAARIDGSKMCFSKMGKKARSAALESFRAGQTHCLIATSLADEGLDLPNANVLILVSGGRSRAKTEQRTGRVLRSFSGKTHGIIYDFEDKCHPLMAKHALRRGELYESLGYEITFEE